MTRYMKTWGLPQCQRTRMSPVKTTELRPAASQACSLHWYATGLVMCTSWSHASLWASGVMWS